MVSPYHPSTLQPSLDFLSSSPFNVSLPPLNIKTATIETISGEKSANNLILLQQIVNKFDKNSSRGESLKRRTIMFNIFAKGVFFVLVLWLLDTRDLIRYR